LAVSRRLAANFNDQARWVGELRRCEFEVTCQIEDHPRTAGCVLCVANLLQRGVVYLDRPHPAPVIGAHFAKAGFREVKEDARRIVEPSPLVTEIAIELDNHPRNLAEAPEANLLNVQGMRPRGEEQETEDGH
jgi:hypothetical protein